MSIDAGEDAWEAVLRLNGTGQKGQLLVVDGSQVLGLVTKDNLGRLIRARMQLQT